MTTLARVMLAPMEGVIDHWMREIFTEIGGYDLCVTEFVRVTQSVLPPHVFYRYCPELLTGGRTRTGVPVYVQLLGSHLEYMAANAYEVYRLGALGIDINFGCPSKKVNAHEGGCILLEEPERVGRIVKAVRGALPWEIPVTAKIRLGVKDKQKVLENARAIEEAGASHLVVHARTKEDGYRLPAHWEWIAKVRATVQIPVIANGDIWSLAAYQRCCEVSGAEAVMLGRGALRTPTLGLEIQSYLAQKKLETRPWPWVCFPVSQLYEKMSQEEERHQSNRLKQWVQFLKQQYPEATILFDKIKQESRAQTIYEILREEAQGKEYCLQR